MVNLALNPILRPARYSEPAKADLADLRQKLLALNVWPEAGDEFLALLPASRWHSPPLTDEDSEWLKIVAKDVLKGVDIGANFPAFFQKLITNQQLRQAFLEELELQTTIIPATNGNGIHKQ